MSDEHDLGLRYDLPRLMGRRAVLAGALGVLATGAAADVCAVTLPEMAGPFPADGSQRRLLGRAVNILDEVGIVREDIRPSLGGLTPVAEGAPFAISLTVVDVAVCAPLAGLAVYVWQCDAAGRYSMYEDTDRNYLRGVGVTDVQGHVRFTSIYPGCYSNRWPHIHFEVFADADAAVSGAAPLLTSQLALPEAPSAAIYAGDAVYANSARNLPKQDFDRDMIWRDNTAAQKQQIMMQLSGSGADLTGSCQIGLAV